MADISDTRQRILNAAAELYAQIGYEAMSLRALTEAAGVNLAAVNYHFGSKQALIVTLVRESVVPMNAKRLQRLDAIMRRYGDSPPPVEEVIDAYLRPLFEVAGEDGDNCARVLRITGRVLTEPESFWTQFEDGNTFCAAIARCIDAIHRALPHLSREDAEWRFFFMISTLIGSFVQCRRATNNCRCNLSHSDADEMLRRMIRFVAGGCLDSADAAPAADAEQTGATAVNTGCAAAPQDCPV